MLSGTRSANSVKEFATPARLGLFDLKLSSRGKEIFIFSVRRGPSLDVCCTNSSNNVGFFGVVERGLSMGIVLNKKKHL